MRREPIEERKSCVKKRNNLGQQGLFQDLALERYLWDEEAKGTRRVAGSSGGTQLSLITMVVRTWLLAQIHNELNEVQKKHM